MTLAVDLSIELACTFSQCWDPYECVVPFAADIAVEPSVEGFSPLLLNLLLNSPLISLLKVLNGRIFASVP